MSSIRCAACQSLLPDLLVRQASGVMECPFCHRRTESFILPALYKSALNTPPPISFDPPAEGEAACFYSPNRKATKSCDHCGVFISDAWAAQWGNQTVCLKCLEQLRLKVKDQRFESTRTLWDNVSLGLAVGPFIIAIGLLCTLVGYVFAIFPLMLTIICAPAAIFVAIRYWSAPRSIAPRGPWRLLTAMAFSLLVISGWILSIAALVDKWK